MIANSDSFSEVIERANRLATKAEPILLVGRRGTGKDTLARFIHELQGRRRFELVDCTQDEDALKRSLVGYFNPLRAAIAFDPETEAYEPGKLELVEDGTIYLDRIDLAPRSCVDLLVQVLRGRDYTPVGIERCFKQGDICFIGSCEPHPFAPNPDDYLHAKFRMVFRERIIHLPDLRERLDDIPALVGCFSAEISHGIEFDFTDDFFQTLFRHEWTGNIWDLRSTIREIVARLPSGGRVGEAMAEEILQSLSSRQTEPREYSRKARCNLLARGMVYQHVPIEGARLYGWIDQFTSYRGTHNIDPRDIAEELVRAIHVSYYYSNSRLRTILQRLFQELLLEIEREPDLDWPLPSSRRGNTRKARTEVVISNPVGPMKSPEAMHLTFRSISGLVPTRNAVEFDRLPQRIEAADRLVVIFLDDFLGTGGQFADVLNKQLLANDRLRTAIRAKGRSLIRFYVLVCVAYEEGLLRAVQALREAPTWLKMKLLAGDILRADSKVFSSESSVFRERLVRSVAEDIVVRQIGARLHPSAPEGWGGLQSLVVFEHNTPNDSLPVIWKDGQVGNQLWRALFPRMGTV